jgi:hypothetical protein
MNKGWEYKQEQRNTSSEEQTPDTDTCSGHTSILGTKDHAENTEQTADADDDEKQAKQQSHKMSDEQMLAICSSEPIRFVSAKQMFKPSDGDITTKDPAAQPSTTQSTKHN